LIKIAPADECEKGTSMGFAEAGALVTPTPVGGDPLVYMIKTSVRPLQNDTKVLISSSPGLTGGFSVFKDFLDSGSSPE
jgi:hypothetical protein